MMFSFIVPLLLQITLMTQSHAAVFQQPCGIRFFREGKVVGGNEANPGQFPWVVSVRLQVLETVSPAHFCGGVIVGQRWILTAAHCVAKYRAKSYTVRAGSFYRTRNDDPNMVDHKVTKIVKHPSYNYPNYYNDIALLKLDKPIYYDASSILPICLPPVEKEYVGWNGTVAGWGWLDENRNKLLQPESLHHVRLPIKDDKTCRKYYSRRKITLLKTQMCAGYEEGGRDSCQGDSGGPLLVQEDGRFYVAGVVSAGIGCARPRLPGLYTKVSYYRDWILNQIDSKRAFT